MFYITSSNVGEKHRQSRNQTEGCAEPNQMPCDHQNAGQSVNHASTLVVFLSDGYIMQLKTNTMPTLLHEVAYPNGHDASSFAAK